MPEVPAERRVRAPTSGCEREPADSRHAHLSRRALVAGGAGWIAACAASGSSAPRSQVAPSANASNAISPNERDDRAAASKERFADLIDQRATCVPIDERDRAARRLKLGRLLAERAIDAFLCEGGPTLSYLAGVSWGRSERFFALVVLADGTHFWLSPAFEESKARQQIDGTNEKPGPRGEIVTWNEDEYAFAPLARELRRRGVQRLAVEPSLRFGMLDRLLAAARSEKSNTSTALLDDRGAVVSGSEILVALRGRKEPKEIALLRRANELTQLALKRVADEVRPGMNGHEIGELVSNAHERLGFSGSWNLSLIGPAAALPHGDATERALARGDVLLIDCGGGFLGYQSDNTRTWVPFGDVDAEVARAWRAVSDAQRAAFDGIRPGRRCREIDALARERIEKAGYPGKFAVFTHRLGHGIGLEGHEDPYFDGASEVVLESGMTLSDEPGIYVPGRFGVRLEDIVHVTADGAESFGSWQRTPSSPA